MVKVIRNLYPTTYIIYKLTRKLNKLEKHYKNIVKIPLKFP